MKYRCIRLIYILSMCFLLVACGSTTNDINVNDGNDKSPDNTRNVNESNKDDEKQTESNTTMTEKVLADSKGVKITAQSLDSSLLGPSLKVLIENNSNQNITTQARLVSINGYMVDSSFSADVAAGKKMNDSIVFLLNDIENDKIGDIGEIELQLAVFDSDTWDDLFVTDFVTVTVGKNTPTVTADTEGDVLYDEKGLKIIHKGLAEESSIFGDEVVFYIENNTKDTVTVQSRDVSINGFMSEVVFSVEITPNKKAYEGMVFLDLEDNGIEKIEDVELYFEVIDEESWDTIAKSKVIKLSYQ